KSIKEIVENLKRKNIKLNTSKKKKLLKFKRIINGFTKKNNNKRIRKKLVHQSGGFLPTLIPIVLSLIESFK
ncbi:MAG: hypothetical protein QM535_20105, partial [Limnohabitans sp.]|nr:hypothetical protein [Limnohabitans sp.]